MGGVSGASTTTAARPVETANKSGGDFAIIPPLHMAGEIVRGKPFNLGPAIQIHVSGGVENVEKDLKRCKYRCKL